MAGRGPVLASRVESLLARAGTNFGAGELKGTLRRVTGVTGPSYAPTGQATRTYSFTGLWSEFEVQERLTDLVEDGDHRLLIGAKTLEIDPRVGDTVTVGSITYTVKQVRAIRPGGTALLFDCIVRT